MQEKKDYAIFAIIMLFAVIVGGLVLNNFTGSPIKGEQLVYSGANSAGFEKIAMMGSTGFGYPQLDKRLISVSGSVTKTYQPDQALLTLSVETLDKSASNSQAKNAQLSGDVRNALKSLGLADENIKTASYYLSEDYSWDENTKKTESIGFRTTNTIEVKVADLSMTGKVIDAAVEAGVNKVSNITFSLSRDREEQVRSELLAEAASNAKSRAEKIATGFGVSIARLYTASEGYSYYPVYSALNYAKDAVLGERIDTPITAGDVKVTVNVDAQFELA